MPEKNDLRLVGRLARLTAAGSLDADVSLSVIGELAGPAAEADTLIGVIDELGVKSSPARDQLRAHIREVRFAAAARHRNARLLGEVASPATAVIGDLPLAAEIHWSEPLEAVAAVARVRALFPDLERLRECDAAVPAIRARLETEFAPAREQVLAAYGHCGDEVLALIRDRAAEREGGGGFVVELDQIMAASGRNSVAEHWRQFAATEDAEERLRRLDQMLCQPDARFAEGLLAGELSQRELERAELVLTVRFGNVTGLGWEGWGRWLRTQAEEQRARRHGLVQVLADDPVLWLIWYRSRSERNEATESWLRSLCPPAAAVEAFTGRWEEWLSREEWHVLDPAAARLPAAPPPLPKTELKVTKAPPVQPPVVPLTPEPKPAPRPSFWQTHVQPLLSENWYVFAGIAMVIAGASLLAYYTWDKAWWLRYTIMPALLGLFTGSLPRLATWMEARGEDFKDTGAILRGAAIGLLPLNFMVVALLAKDASVPGRAFMALLLGSIYLLLFGKGLVRWCRAVHEPMATTLAGSLLFLAALVAGVPVANEWTGGDWTVPGFYAGFLVMSLTIMGFARRITPELASEGRVPWFLGTTLAGTFVQAFAWVHGSLRLIPEAADYAPLAIGVGGLVLLVERRHLELFPTSEGARHKVESFLGYAFLLLGILLGAGDPWMRLVVFGMAGGVWLYQARAREAALHHWIGLTFLVLAGASVGLLPGFPKAWLAGLGIGMALALGGARRWARKQGMAAFAEAAGGIQTSVLVLTAVVAVLAQWHHQSAPLMTGGWLAGLAAIFLVAALNENRLAWLHTAMAVLALALPYLGCVDLAKRTLHGNTMVFGLAVLSFLWLAANWLSRHALLRAARSTVLWLYGVLATTGMIVRVLLERGSPFDPLWYLNYMDYAGPLMITVALVFATVYSRSLISAFMAIVIVVILFPELKANLRGTFVDQLWGTGLGSAASALALVLGCFWLRGWERLRELPDGDRLFGRDRFPLRRHDHTLFTWPMLVAAIVLAVRVDTWTLLQNLLRGGAGMRTAWAVCMTAVTWPALAVYCRESVRAKAGAVAGAVWLLVGLQLVNRNLAEPRGLLWVMMGAAVVLQIAVFVAQSLQAKGRDWLAGVLVAPWNRCLRALSLIAVGTTCFDLLFQRSGPDLMFPAMVFAGLLIWHGRSARQSVYGLALYVLVQTVVLDRLVPGSRGLLLRLGMADLLPTAVWVNAAFMLPHVVRGGAWREDLRPLLSPTMACAGVVTLLIGALMLGGTAVTDSAALASLWLPLFVTASLAAWVNRSGLFAVLLLLLGYEFVQLRGVEESAERFARLLEPWRMTALAVAMVAMLRIAQAIFKRAPEWLRPGANVHRLFQQSPTDWIHAVATVAALGAVTCYSLDSGLRAVGLETLTPYLAAVALGWIGWWRREGWFQVTAVVSTFLGNYHLVRCFLGEPMRVAGLSEVHVFCLGVGVSLGQIALLRNRLAAEKGGRMLHIAGMWLGGAILSLLAANYFIEADLAAITGSRFLFSGTLALLTGWYFRQITLAPGAGEETQVDTARGFYHFGVILAIWCLALLVPWLRSPALVLIPLALPVFYFYLRAEEEFELELPSATAYRGSAAVMGFLVLALYAGRSACQMVLFPDQPIGIAHYHQNAPLLILVSLVLLRLHGLGGTAWLAFYGGLGLMVGSYFVITWPPVWSPFEQPIAAAWVAVLLAHFWITTAARPSPLRSFVQRIAGLDEPGWVATRRPWGVALAIAVHGVWLMALDERLSRPLAMAPLLLGVATVMLHQGVVRRSVVWLALGGLEFAGALHADLVLPSYLPADSVMWVLLGFWCAALLLSHLRPTWLPPRPMGFVATGFAALIMAHVLYHRAWSDAGLWAVLIGGALAALNPQREREALSLDERLAAATLLFVPIWLTFFWVARMGGVAAVTDLNSSCLLAGMLAVFVTGEFAGWCRTRLPEWQWAGARLYCQSLAACREHGDRIRFATAAVGTTLAAGVQVGRYGRAFAVGELTLLLTLYAGLAFSWVRQTQKSGKAISAYAAQFCLAAFFVAVRRQLMLTTEVWNYEYDVWAALAVSFCLAGAKQHWDQRENRSRLSLLVAMFVLPTVACIWIFLHHLGTDVALLVVGLYSLQFTYMGRDQRESPYNAVATFGFVAFVLISFWGKLEVRYVHAYVIPVGVGVLVLLQLFGRGLSAELRNRVRLVTLIAMIGSAGYYALVDDRHTLAFNLTVIVLALLAMGLGSLLRVRLYLAIGLSALLIDLVAIVYKVIVRLDDQSRMSSVGGLILTVGAALVAGAIYYKTHAETLGAKLHAWRGRAEGWE